MQNSVNGKLYVVQAVTYGGSISFSEMKHRCDNAPQSPSCDWWLWGTNW